MPAHTLLMTSAPMLTVVTAGATKLTSTLAVSPAKVAVTWVLPVWLLDMYANAWPLLPVVVTAGVSVAKVLDSVNVTVAPPTGLPSSSTVAVIWSLSPLAACVEFCTTTDMEEGVDERSGETWVLNVPMYDCGEPEAHCAKLALGHGMALSLMLPDASEPRDIALTGTVTSQIMAPPWSTLVGVHELVEEVPL